MKISSPWLVCAACLAVAACGEERQLPERPDAPPASRVDAPMPVNDAPSVVLDSGAYLPDVVLLADAPPPRPDGPPAIDAHPRVDADLRPFDARPSSDSRPAIDAHPSNPDAGIITACGDHITQPPEQCDDGNGISGDGCEPDCTLSVAEDVLCETLAPLPQGVCAVTAGNDVKLLKGDVLTPGRIFRGGQVAVDATGHIACVGCDCAASAAGATVITCPRGAISPGLINTHDHITFTQNAPYTDTGERYEQRHDWRSGIRGHTRLNTPGNASGDEISWGELRQLLGGTTSLVGSGSKAGLLRNLDVASAEEGLGQTRVDFSTFPLDDSASIQRTGDCNYGSGPDDDSTIAGDDSYEPHVSEGIDAVARNEFFCMSSTRFDVTAPGVSHDLAQGKSAFIHAIGLYPPDYQLMGFRGTALIWSPRSNITLYGNTAEVTVAARAGVEIALGTDWTRTGSINLLRELRCADEWNTTYLDGFFADQQLWRMVTLNAARVTATDDVVGALAPGKVADIAVFDASVNDGYRAVVAADPPAVALVLRAGKPLYGEGAAIAALTTDTCDALDVCGSEHRVCLQSEIGKNLAALTTSVGTIYGAVFCATPDNEPTCVPSRPKAVNRSTIYTGQIVAGDADGDGVPDATDDCPSVFNPARPVDNGRQADFDGDGVGDACDPCPTTPGTAGCTPFDPADADSDGVADTVDNCVGYYNPTQIDSDGDLKGDACDLCPNDSNPGNEGCPTTIYDIKNGTVAFGSNVKLTNALVTGRNATGFFLQVKLGDLDFAGPDFSGIFVFAQGNTVAVGDRVNISSATVADFFGEIELTTATIQPVTSGEAPPAPVPVAAADVATGGPRAAQLEGVIVQVTNATVTDIAPTGGTNEFVVDATIRVDDFLFLIAPFPVVGQNFASITGILAFRNDQSKIHPRNALDYVAGASSLTAFGPTPTFVNEATTGVPTFPQPLKVTVTPSSIDVFVPIVSSNTDALEVVGGGVTVPGGQTSATVLVNGKAPAADVTLTATLGQTLTAHVRVVGAAETPKVVSLLPPTADISPGGTVMYTVSLDLPAPTGGVMVAASVAPANAGVLPPIVLVPEGAFSAQFGYTDANQVSAATVTVTFGASIDATVTVNRPHLVINEVDYDQAGTDSRSFIEIFNGTGADVPLADLALVLVNGNNNAEYAPRQTLSNAGTTLPDGGYLVIGNATITDALPPGVLKMTVAGDFLQNGSPDGLALVNTAQLTVIDVLSYEGPMTAVTITGFPGPVSLVEPPALAATVADTNDDLHSLIRAPNGQDTNHAADDWKLTTTITPGTANVLTP